MIAIVSAVDGPVSYELLSAARSLQKQSAYGCVPAGSSPGHQDGCGFAFSSQGELVSQKRGRAEAWDISFAKAVEGIRTRFLIAHDRKASAALSAENVGPAQAHPYLARCGDTPLAFAHNGGIGHLMAGANARKLTDTQIFLEEILAGLGSLETESLRQRVSELVRRYGKEKNPYTSLTAMLLCPEALFVWRLFRPDSPDAAGWYSTYYSLWMRRSDDKVVIASEPVDVPDYDGSGRELPGWSLLPNKRFVAVRLAAGKVCVTEAELDP